MFIISRGGAQPYLPEVSFKGGMHFAQIRLVGLPVVTIHKLIMVTPITREFMWKVYK